MNKHKLTMEIVEEYFLDFTHDYIPLDVTVRLSKLMLTLLLYDKKRKHELDDYWYYFFSYALNIWRSKTKKAYQQDHTTYLFSALTKKETPIMVILSGQASRGRRLYRINHLL